MGKIASYIEMNLLNEIINRLLPDNRLIMRIALETGMRISDVLEIREGDIRNNRSIVLVEHKTGKVVRRKLSAALRREIMTIKPYSGEDGYYLFPHRDHPRTRHRVRSTVNKDIYRVLRDMGIQGSVSPHSARKGYAVALYARTEDLDEVRKALNHEYKSTTIVYALADKMRPTSYIS